MELEEQPTSVLGMRHKQIAVKRGLRVDSVAKISMAISKLYPKDRRLILVKTS